MANSALHSTLGTVPGQLFLSAAGMWSSITSGASVNTQVEMATNLQNIFLLDFADGALSISAQATVVMPSDWNGSTITATFYWLVNGATTGNVVWQCRGRAYANGNAIDQAFGTAQSVTTAATGTANQLIVTSATPAITLSGAPAASQLVQFKVFRDPTNASDTLAATARLVGVMITYTRS